MQAATNDKPDWLTENLARVLIWISGIAAALAAVAIWFYASHFQGPVTDSANAAWGQFGDFFGGVLNPTFSFLALLGLLLTLYVQSKELRLSREMAKLSLQELELTKKELKNSAEALIAQNESINLQRFEQTFFAWLDSYRSLIDQVYYKDTLHKITLGALGGVTRHGREALQEAHRDNLSADAIVERLFETGALNRSKYMNLKDAIKLIPPDVVPAFRNAFMNQRHKFLGKGFNSELRAPITTLQALLVWIDSQTSFSEDRKQLYFGIVSSHLSWIEGYFLFLMCIGNEWPTLRRIVSQHKLLEGFDWEVDSCLPIVMPLLDSVNLPPSK